MLPQTALKLPFLETFCPLNVKERAEVKECDQIRSFLLIWSHLLKESLMENFFFCAVSFNDFCFSSVSETAIVTEFIIKRKYSITCDGIKVDLHGWMTNPSELKIFTILKILSKYSLKISLSLIRSSK